MIKLTHYCIVSIEMGELWEGVNTEIGMFQAVEQKAQDQAAANKAAEKAFAEKLEQEREAAVDLIISVYEEVRANSATVRQYPLSEIERIKHTHPYHDRIRGGFDVVVLRWGNKFEMTPEDEEHLTKYTDRMLPSAIVLADYYRILNRVVRRRIHRLGRWLSDYYGRTKYSPGPLVDEGYMSIEHCAPVPVLLTDPGELLKGVAKQLLHPEHIYEITDRGYSSPPRWHDIDPGLNRP